QPACEALHGARDVLHREPAVREEARRSRARPRAAAEEPGGRFARDGRRGRKAVGLTRAGHLLRGTMSRKFMRVGVTGSYKPPFTQNAVNVCQSSTHNRTTTHATIPLARRVRPTISNSIHSARMRNGISRIVR